MANANKITWSKSRIKLISNCPKAYDYRYIQQIKGDTPESLVKGVILHDLFDKYYDFKNINLAIKQLNIDNEFILKYEDHINNFMDFNKKYKLKPVIKEEKYYIDEFVGIVDRVDLIDGKYTIIDYKTSNGSDIETYMDELLLYAYMIQKKKNITVEQVGIFFTGNNKLIIKDITQEQIIENLQEIREEIELHEEMITKCMYPRTFSNCHWCSYQTLCKKEHKLEEAQRDGSTGENKTN